MGLLWLALCSTAVLPWAHELAHLTGHGPGTAPHAIVGQGDAPTAAAGTAARTPDGDVDPVADACQVCLHLVGQHLSPASSGGSGLLALGQQHAPAAPAEPAPPAPPGWLTPAPRAPPSLLS